MPAGQYAADLKVLMGFQSKCKQTSKQMLRIRWYIWIYLLILGQSYPNTINADEYFNMWIRIWVSCVYESVLIYTVLCSIVSRF